MHIDLQTLLREDPDLTMYEIKPGDKETLAQISIAELKEILLAINGSSRRIHYLYTDLQQSEARIDELEHRLNAITGYQEEQPEREPQRQSNETQTETQKECMNRLAKVESTHAYWKTCLRAHRQDALHTMWQWPPGITIPLYKVLYYNSFDQGHIEQTHGWATTDQPDAEGYIRLEATKNVVEPRTLNLIPTLHSPIWERHLVSSISQLPHELRQDITIRLPGVTLRWYEAFEESFFTEDKASGGEDYTEVIGTVPLTWIRALIDQKKGT